jgi:hypothetical protein
MSHRVDGEWLPTFRTTVLPSSPSGPLDSEDKGNKSFETSVNLYQPTRRSIPEEQHRSGNLKFNKKELEKIT